MTDIETDIETDICVIGGGAAGLSVAAGAAQMGARTVLIEAGRMGGECLNTGCVPSKSLLAAAKAAQDIRNAARYGIGAPEPWIDFPVVHAYTREVIAAIAPHDSEERFTALGCRVIRAHARFADARTVEAGGRRIRARRFVIATGSRAAIPAIPGLDQIPYFTNETLFDNTVRPEHLVIIGAGPIGCEMAQAYRRLGAGVTLLDHESLLSREDPEAAAVLRRAFLAEGIVLAERVKIRQLDRQERGIGLALTGEGGAYRILASHLLVAAGRKPNVAELGLEAAGIRFGPGGIEVDARLRTSNRRVFAAGDVTGGPQFTHLAAHHAGVILRNALFRLPARTDIRSLPRVTYTDPELAQAGMTEEEARRSRGDDLRVLRSDFAENDRARTENAAEGMIKVMVSKRGRVLGATIIGRHAGELILPWVLAIDQGLRIGAMAKAIVPYPSLSEISKQAAGSFYAPTLFGRPARALVRFLGLFG